MKRFPNAIVIILGVIVLSWVLTFIFPRGSYDRLTNPDTRFATATVYREPSVGGVICYQSKKLAINDFGLT